jgi:phage shock protein PspC (stress-responsive transcriptional regulator)
MNDTPNINPPQAGDSEATEERAPGSRKLLRSSSDRVLGGVAGGLGRHFGVDPVIFRIGFVISVFFGGVGAIAYLLFALFVPTDGEPDRPQRIGERLRATGIWRALGIAVVAVIAVAGLFVLAGAAAFAVGLGWGIPVGIAIVALGALLTFAAFRGGARWLIAPAVALAVGASVSAAADIDFRGGIGEREYHPVAVSAIPTDGYRLGVGRLVVDLRDLPWDRTSVIRVRANLGAGQESIFVPARVCVLSTSHVGFGESEVAGERDSGVDVNGTTGAGSTATPRLVLDAGVDAGQLRVINSDSAGVDNVGYGPGPFHEDTAPQRAAQASACGVG